MPALKDSYSFDYRGYRLIAAKDRVESERRKTWPCYQWGVWIGKYFFGYFEQEPTPEVQDIRRAACKCALGKKH